jgi:hypothetical protein
MAKRVFGIYDYLGRTFVAMQEEKCKTIIFQES